MDNQIYEGFTFINIEQYEKNGNRLFKSDNTWVLSKNITQDASSDYLGIFNINYLPDLEQIPDGYKIIYIRYALGNKFVLNQVNYDECKQYLVTNNISSMSLLKKHCDSYSSNIKLTKQIRLQESKIGKDYIEFTYIFNPECIKSYSENELPKDNNNVSKNKNSLQYFWWYIWNIPQHIGWSYFFIYVLPLIAFIIGLIIGRIA